VTVNDIPYPIDPAITARIARLPDLDMPAIKALWQQLFDKEVPTRNRRFLERRIAYRLQEIEFAKVHPEILERNRQRIEALMACSAKPGRKGDALLPGTVLTREYLGVPHQVTVTAEGTFAYQGRPYKSLSMIAREITGTRWSGPAFFGLRPAATRKNKRMKGDQR